MAEKDQLEIDKVRIADVQNPTPAALATRVVFSEPFSSQVGSAGSAIHKR
jgi:hypothetical protein